MIGGLIVFVMGGCVGACAVIINMKLVEARTEDLAKENRKLQAKLEDVKEERITYEAMKAYRRGYHDGKTGRKTDEPDKTEETEEQTTS